MHNSHEGQIPECQRINLQLELVQSHGTRVLY